jgi:hypothetical protein
MSGLRTRIPRRRVSYYTHTARVNCAIFSTPRVEEVHVLALVSHTVIARSAEGYYLNCLVSMLVCDTLASLSTVRVYALAFRVMDTE